MKRRSNPRPRDGVSPSSRPRARREGLVVHDVHDEIVIYDLERHKASCLNGGAALVWRCADGKTTVDEIAQKLRATTGEPMDSHAVWLALERLAGAHLLEQGPPDKGGEAHSRRECMRQLARLGVRAALLPAVVSIVAPQPADAASVIGPNICRMLPRSACHGQPCSNGKRCYYDMSKGRCRCG